MIYTDYMADTYTETDAEIEELQGATHEYIFGGDPLYEVCDLRGLGVYGVIRYLRQHDDLLHGLGSELTPEQKQRLEEVESEVDKAVAQARQFYPFGHKTDEKYGIDYSDPANYNDRQRANYHSHPWSFVNGKKSAQKYRPLGPLETIVKPRPFE
ncbi:MAG: hypothetical protein JWS12_208 [Candidatus Saccharibacteria bacterium]|nr:hypothetical protein [Candidatus Saccharibacteria bacterium]